MGSLINLTGERFGRLVAAELVRRDGDSRAYWRCICDCGGTSVVAGKSLRNGATKSCGCLSREWASKMGADPSHAEAKSTARQTHGHKRGGKASREYLTWLAIKRRCCDPKFKDFPNWGGRGIMVCDRWIDSFESFFADMGSRPSPEHQIDRIDPNGNYEPSNCRWATASEQTSEHRRNLIEVTIGGERFPSLSAAARHFGVGVTTVHERVRNGMTVEAALFLGQRRKRADRTRESYLRKDRRT